MVLLVTAEELASHLQQDGLDRASAEQAIRTSSAWVESTTGLAFTSRTSTIRLPAGWARQLYLPMRPVRSVAAVTIGGVPFTDFTVTAEGHLWRASGWQTAWAPQTVEMTVTYGLEVTPDDVKGVVFEVAGGIVDGRLGVESQRIDDFQVAYSGVLSETSQKTLANYGSSVGTTAMRGQ